MAYESKREPGRKFGSAFRGRKFDSYSPEQPKVESTPEEHSSDKVNQSNTGDTSKNKSSMSDHVATPSSTVQDHGPAHTVHYHHDRENNKHTVTSLHPDGHSYSSEYDKDKLAYEAGGELSATDVKKREHPDQQGAESEERNYEMPDLA